MSNDEKSRILILRPCHTANCCPEIFLDPAALPEKAILITDDFQSSVSMSVDQFREFVRSAKKGELDYI